MYRSRLVAIYTILSMTCWSDVTTFLVWCVLDFFYLNWSYFYLYVLPETISLRFLALIISSCSTSSVRKQHSTEVLQTHIDVHVHCIISASDSGGSRKVEKGGQPIRRERFWLINYSWVTFIRISSQEDPWATWNSSASLANSVNQRWCLSCGPKKAVIYCIVASVTKECVNTIMNINILVAEKGWSRPPGPHCWIRHRVIAQLQNHLTYKADMDSHKAWFTIWCWCQCCVVSIRVTLG